MAELRALPPQEAKLKDIELQGVFKDIYEVVEELPSENIRTDVIYCVPLDNPTEGNEYGKWLYVNGDWESLGGGQLESSGIFVIDSTSVPESVNWGESIPYTYAGQTGIVNEINVYLGSFYQLASVVEQDGTTFYNWGRMTIPDLVSYISSQAISQLRNGTPFSLPDKSAFGFKLSEAGESDNIQAYSTERMDALLDKKMNNITYSAHNPPHDDYITDRRIDDLWFNRDSKILFRLIEINASSDLRHYTWKRENNRIVVSSDSAPARTENNLDYQYDIGDIWAKKEIANSVDELVDVSICVGKQRHQVNYNTYYFSYTWVSMSQKFLTLSTLPIYDGTVV